MSSTYTLNDGRYCKLQNTFKIIMVPEIIKLKLNFVPNCRMPCHVYIHTTTEIIFRCQIFPISQSTSLTKMSRSHCLALRDE